MDSPVRGEGEFNERMEYLADAIKKMINTVNTERETHRLQHLNIGSKSISLRPLTVSMFCVAFYPVL